MLREIEHDWTGSPRTDNHPAVREIIRARQVEALSFAWLLTGNRTRSYGLAEAAFVELFHDLRKLEPDADLRERLLLHLARAFLQGNHLGTATSEPEPVHDAASEKFGVENQRERTLGALGRLQPHERVALLLSDMCGIDPDGLQDDAAALSPGPARQRMRDSLDVAADDSLRPLLVEAGFDGPRDDLWPQLEYPYTEIERREKRRQRLLTLGVAGVVVLMAAVSVVAIFGPEIFGGDEASGVAVATPTVVQDTLVLSRDFQAPPTPTPAPPAMPAGDVPGTLLAQTQHNARSAHPYNTLAMYQPDTNEIHPLLDEPFAWMNSDPFLISPDGQQIVLMKREQTATTSRYTVVAFDSRSLERQWEFEIGLFDRGDEQYGPSVRVSTTISADRVYVAVLNPDTPDGIHISAFHLQTGALQATGTIDIHPLEIDLGFRGNAILYAYGKAGLLLGVEVYDWVTSGSRSSFFYHVDASTLERRGDATALHGTDGPRFPIWGARMTPDGDALYAHTLTPEDEVQVVFLNPGNCEVTALPLPFVKHRDEHYPSTTAIPSPGGRKLYILHQASGHVAIVDLVAQRIERSFPLDAGRFDELFGTGSGQYTLGWANALSTSGTRLLISAQAGGPNMRSAPPPEGGGVWVIDLNEWRITDFWPADGQVSKILPIPNEPAVLVSSWLYSSADGHSVQTLARYDLTADSPVPTPVDLPAADENSSALLSLVDLYRAQHGRSPSIDGVKQPGPDDIQTLPQIEASITSNNVATGVPTQIEVHILDPASGEPLSSTNPAVRFDPDSTVSAVLTDEDGTRQIIVLARIDEGTYRGSVTFENAAFWTIDVIVTGSEGTLSVSSDVGWVNVAPTFIGSDDRLYQFSVTSNPEQPQVDEKTTVQVRLIDIKSGVPLPDGVTLAAEQPALNGNTVEAMPERVGVTFTIEGINESGGFRTALLYPASPGLYEGTIDLWESGVWHTEIRFQPPGGRRVTIPAGTVEVVE